MQARLLKYLFLLDLGGGWDHSRQRMLIWVSCMALALLPLSMASTCSADSMTFNVSFSATGFTGYNFNGPIPGAIPPNDPFSGSFSITFDPTVNTPDTSTGGSFTYTGGGSFALSAPLTLGYNYNTTSHDLFIGGMGGGDTVQNLPTNTNDFCLELRWNGTNLTYGLFFDYVSTVTPDVWSWRASSGSASANPVPLPGAVWLLGSGLLGLGGWKRFRKS